jgi:hypothetical protein
MPAGRRIAESKPLRALGRGQRALYESRAHLHERFSAPKDGLEHLLHAGAHYRASPELRGSRVAPHPHCALKLISLRARGGLSDTIATSCAAAPHVADCRARVAHTAFA